MEIKLLEPKTLWNHFTAINAIPRASRKEEEISAYMVKFGTLLDLETSVDDVGNVIIRKPGTKGKEKDGVVVLQGHLDMVHQKKANSNFDFDTQGIQMYVDNDWVKARDTTLGADNGIGVAAIMAILSSKELRHPPIEALFTIDEETGMTGAMALTANQLQGNILLNLDSEEDDQITIGCAGGIDVEVDGNFQGILLNTDEYEFRQIRVEGLTGGHSGVDIHLNTANAIIVLIRLVNHLVQNVNCRLHSVKAGTQANVIPRNGVAVLAIPSAKTSKFEHELLGIVDKIKLEYIHTDSMLNIEQEEYKGKFEVLDEEVQNDLLRAILKTPNGVYSMTEGIDDLVQTSNNISIINIENGSFEIICHTRSSIDAERDLVADEINRCFSFANVSGIEPYPGWKPKPNSNLLNTAIKCYRELNGKTPQVRSIHAGLECGVIAGVYPNMEMISIGPNIMGAHSPQERLQISSTQKFWKFLTELLEIL